MASDRWAYCDNCEELFTLDVMTEVILHDPNQKVMNPNSDIHILLCPSCLSGRTKASEEANQ